MSNEGVVAVERALSLLNCFRPNSTVLTLTELANSAGLHKTTALRLLNSLVRMSFVIRHTDGRYGPGPRLLFLGELYLRSFSLEPIVEPAIRALSDQTNESVSYYVAQDKNRLCLFRAEPAQGLRDAVYPGTTFLMKNTSTDKVLRLFSDTRDRDGPTAPLPFFTAGTGDKHLASFSAPVFDVENKLVAALTLSGPISRLKESDRKIKGALLIKTALSISMKLGANEQLCRRLYESSPSSV